MIEAIINIWKVFEVNNVKYITIGGFAVNIYGYTRNTGDLDILIEDSLENRKNLRKAFIEIGIGDFESIETMQFIPGWTDFTLFFGLRLDVMTSIKGLENVPFEELLEKATKVIMGNVAVNFIDYDNLIIAKKATNRLKDKLDLEELNKINNPDKE
ncbi:MAG TPA: nucleotidyltransferase [Flavobacterium sp.]|uniref:nucleotidyltransferase n=1 Tax=unclassified Flavobacterium TaxID=196869 RepID=UPI0025C56F0C|nr:MULTISPECIES: nucleotidyltransferase [unclassified Flavobacterium]HRE78980.1 nucleotidyltransferase [Flavobacterium sp.]